MHSRFQATPDDEGPPAAGGELLYESSSTRVWRTQGPHGACILKEYIGPAAAGRFAHERGMLARLGGVAGVVQLAPRQPDGPPVLALADPGGHTLARELAQGRVDADRVVDIGCDLALALAAVHRKGIVHRDVNPANIILCADGRAVLADFDLATDAPQGTQAATDGRVVGTLAYLAPEQSGRTGRTADARSDLYALGATLYELATGRPPFDGTDTLELVHHHLVHEPPSPARVDPAVPAALAAIVMRLLAKAPELRYQSAEGLLHDLERLRRGHGADGALELGEHDFAERLEPAGPLVGREAEVARLHEALQEALVSARRTVLLEGGPGVGKSALVQQLRSPAAAAHGRFVIGKFDQFQQDAAASGGWTQALRALGRLLLAQPAEAIERERVRIAECLGANAATLTQLLPEFELLVGAKAEPGDLDPQQAESRLLEATAALLGAVASIERPLVLVLEDLQWAGPLALRTFDRILRDAAIRGLLLVGAFRTPEAGAVLASPLAGWRSGDSVIADLQVGNLGAPALAALVGRMLRLAPERARALADAVGTLTAGNPFDTVETLNSLREEGLLRLAAHGWDWDAAAIRRFAGHGSVIDLLAVRIGRLPPASRLLVEAMSCLGGPAEHEVLLTACGFDADALAKAVQAPLADGLVMPEASGLAAFTFRHDRVQQAVLSGMDAGHRAQLQLDMARRLAARPALARHAARQFLGCIDLLDAPAEARDAAALLHDAAQAAIHAANPALALKYARAASVLAMRPAGAGMAELRGRIDALEHGALYGLGELEQADVVHARLAGSGAPALDLVEPACLQMRSLYIRGRIRESMDLGLDMLTRLGVEVPVGFTGAALREPGEALAQWVRSEVGRHPAERAPATDRHVLGVAKVLARAFPPACFLLERGALAWLVLEAQRLWSAHGPSPSLVVALSRANMVLVLLQGDYRTGYDIANHALATGAAQGFGAEAAEAGHAFAISASHWFEPLEQTARRALAVREAMARHGDASYCCFTYGITNEAARECGPTLDAYAADIEAGLALCARTGNHLAATLVRMEQELLDALRGTQREAGLQHAPSASPVVMPVVRLTSHMRRALAAALLGDWASVELHTGAAMPLLDSVPGFYITAHAHVLRALALAWRMRTDGGGPAPAAAIAASREWLAARAEGQPYNFLHLLRLVEAEEAWAQGDEDRAMRQFQGAMNEADARERPWHQALIAERAAQFHLAQGWTHTGRRLLAEALDGYAAWGAHAKVASLRREHPFLASAAPVRPGSRHGASHSSWGDSNRMSADALDLLGVLKASQALSSETGIERLVARVGAILETLSGATAVKVVAADESGWSLLAPSPGEPPLPLAQAAARGLLPLSVFEYAERTGEPLVLDDATADDRFAADPYFAGLARCAMVAVPIASGAARAVLLLENRLQRAAFNADRLDAVMLITGQLAVSLANSRLYEKLEERVRSRTRELEQMQARLVDTARRAGKAEVANNVLHNVGNVLNSVNVSASVVRRAIGESRAGGLSRAVALLQEHADDLAGFFSRDPRGRAMVDYLGRLAQELGAEREAALADLDRLTASIEHITYVVSTQQSWAGPSSVVEAALPGEVVDEALRLAQPGIDAAGVTVIRESGDVPAAILDRQRVVQILVNLLANAGQAMQGLPVAARRITIGLDAVPAGEAQAAAQLLRIAVRDEGEGIPAENLPRIFSHGFTTRASGHGFGLHSSALAAMEMGGRLTVHSDGPGRGAAFVLELPLQTL